MQNKEYQSNIGLSILNSTALDNLGEVSISLYDSALSIVTDDTILENIPLLGIAVKTLKAGIAINDRIFFNNVSRFLLRLKDISLDEREKFIYDMDKDDTFKRRVADNLILVLNKIDDTGKADLIGDLFKLYIKQKIDYNEYSRFATIINRSHLPDILSILKLGVYDKIKYDDFIITIDNLSRIEMNELYSLGLVTSPIVRIITSDKPGELGVNISQLGRRLITLFRDNSN